MKHAIIDQSGKVVNVVIWEGAPWLPPANCWVVRSEIADIGDSFDFATLTLTKENGTKELVSELKGS